MKTNNIKITGTIVNGYGLAHETLKKQFPYFILRNKYFSNFFTGTINVDIEPQELHIKKYEYLYKNINWARHWTQDFGFIPFKNFKINGRMIKTDGFLYFPTKNQAHNKSQLELICPFIKGLRKGDKLELQISKQNIQAKSINKKKFRNYQQLLDYICTTNKKMLIRQTKINRSLCKKIGNFLFVKRQDKKSGIFLHLGQMFAIDDLSLKLAPAKEKTDIYYYGSLLEDVQTELLLAGLRQSCMVPVKYIVEKSVYKFRRDIKRYISVKKIDKSVIYFPYNAKGDNILNYRAVKIMLNALKITSVKNVSDDLREYKFLGQGFNFNQHTAEARCLAVFPCYLQAQWKKITDEIKKYKNCQNNLFLIPAKSIAIYFDEQEVRVVKQSGNDILLDGTNNFDHKLQCLSKFTDKKLTITPKYISYQRASMLIINPFGSQSNKTLSLKLLTGTLKSVKKSGFQKIFVIGGFKNDKEHVRWVKNLRKIPAGKYIDKFLYFKNLTEIHAFFAKEKKAAVLLTTDTSMAHLANYCGLRNITIFHGNRFSKNIFSMTFESPFGFAGYDAHGWPALIKDKDNVTKTELRSIGSAIAFLGKMSYPKDTSLWINDIFDEKFLNSNLQIPAARKNVLSQTLYKLSPRYKIKNLTL